MKRMWTMLAVLVGLLSDSSRADEIDAALQQARKACRRRGGGVVVIERGDTEWRVVDLTLYGNSLTDTDLEQIGELRTLESLKLGGKARATDEGWRRLSTLPQLKHLTLPPNVTAEGLRALSALKELESLDLIACRGLRDPAPADLTRFRSLRRLTLPAVVVSDAQLVHVKALRNLEELGMSSDGDVDLSGFVPLSDLRSLVIYELGASGATALKSLPGLQRLAVGRFTSERAAMDLAALPHLEDLSVLQCPPGTGPLDLSGLTNIKSLSLGDGFRFAGRPVRLPRNLRRLKAHGWNAASLEAGAFHLSAPLPKNLESIHLTLPCAVRRRRSADLGWLSALPRLREVTLVSATPDELALVAGLSGLLGLALAGERGGPNDESIEHLTKQAALQSLVIEDCRSITDAGLGELASLTSLRRLELGATRRATAAGLVSLWKLTGLEVLCLHLPSEDRDGSVAGAFKGVKSLANLQELCLKGEVTDKTLKNLADLKKLHRLDLSWSHGYTDRGLAELVKSLPALKSLVLSCGVVGAR